MFADSYTDAGPSDGRSAAGDRWGDWLAAWDGFRIEVEELVEEGDAVLALVRFGGRGKVSGIEVDGLPGADVFCFRAGRVARLEHYHSREELPERWLRGR